MLSGAARAEAQNIQITNDPAPQTFFYSMTPSGEAVAISKVEIKDGNNFPNWYEMTFSGGSWQANAGLALSVPASLRITSIDNEVLTSTDVVTSVNPAAVFDFGFNFTPPAAVPISGWVGGAAALAIAGLWRRKRGTFASA